MHTCSGHQGCAKGYTETIYVWKMWCCLEMVAHNVATHQSAKEGNTYLAGPSLIRNNLWWEKVWKEVDNRSGGGAGRGWQAGGLGCLARGEARDGGRRGTGCEFGGWGGVLAGGGGTGAGGVRVWGGIWGWAGSWREEGGGAGRGASLGGGAGSWREDKGLFGETGLQARGQGGRPGTGCCYWGRGRSVGEYRGHLLVDWTGNTVRQ
ncbi:uncharacterized protein LOC128241120 [Mya arenaria]|uniref:uncharacterized protein LOC128241120 n=1 Tax=Mya arenaria TaxID=6604 RepID=UPI0022E65673|nr:uncharacterized protein LOC128241120 [Mya arenaria]